MAKVILLGDCIDVLPTLPAQSCQLCYIDPPFNTGTTRRGLRGSTAVYVLIDENPEAIAVMKKRLGHEKSCSDPSREV